MTIPGRDDGSFFVERRLSQFRRRKGSSPRFPLPLLPSYENRHKVAPLQDESRLMRYVGTYFGYVCMAADR